MHLNPGNHYIQKERKNTFKTPRKRDLRSEVTRDIINFGLETYKSQKK